MFTYHCLGGIKICVIHVIESVISDVIDLSATIRGRGENQEVSHLRSDQTGHGTLLQRSAKVGKVGEKKVCMSNVFCRCHLI